MSVMWFVSTCVGRCGGSWWCGGVVWWFEVVAVL